MDGAMRTPIFQLQEILQAFQRKKVLTKPELLATAGCSGMTAWRLLSQHGYFTSYNHNARHYTLTGIPQFDEHGLWSYRRVRFSKWGSLTKTLVGLVEQSSAGLTAEQMQHLLHLKNVKPNLTRLIAQRALTRERVAGRFVYFSPARAAGTQQRQHRQEEIAQARSLAALPPLEQIVALLVEIIRRPEHTPRQWARRLSRQGVRLGTRDIQAVLDHYQIDPKKGLLRF
jgi:hypothetical protein